MPGVKHLQPGLRHSPELARNLSAQDGHISSVTSFRGLSFWVKVKSGMGRARLLSVSLTRAFLVVLEGSFGSLEM